MADRNSILDFIDWSGGLWISEGDDFSVPPNALLQADDITYLPSGAVRGRRGRTRWDNTNTIPAAVLMLYQHYPRTGSPAFLLSYVNSENLTILHDTAGSGVFSAMTGGTVNGTNARPYAVTWPTKNKTFICNGTSTFGIRSYNGVLSSAITLNGAAGYVTGIDGPYIELWKDRLWLTKDDELNYSVYASSVLDETSYPTGGHLNVSDPQGGSITGLAGLQDLFLIFKKTSIFRLIGDVQFSPQLTLYSERGCVAPNTIQKVPGAGVIYLARDGLYLTDGYDAQGLELSKPIRSIFSSRSTETVYSSAIGIYHPLTDSYYLKLQASDAFVYVLQRVNIPGSGIQWVWWKHTSLPMNCAAVWDSENDKGELFTGDTSGFVWKANINATDNGSSYTPTVQTLARVISPGFPKGRATYARLVYRGSAAVSIRLRYDLNTSDQVTVAAGSTQTLGIQRPWVPITNDTYGQFLSARVLLPSADGYDTELHKLELQTKLRGRRF